MRAPPELEPGQRLDRAVARLQATRTRLRAELVPTPSAEAGLHGAQRRPLRFFRRWWQRTQPLDLLQDWLQARSRGEPLRGATPATAALLNAAGLALDEARTWLRRHPAAGIALAAGIGALAVSQRRVLFRAGLAVGAVASLRTRAWLLRWASDPLTYQTLYALLLAGAASRAQAPDSAGAKPATAPPSDAVG